MNEQQQRENSHDEAVMLLVLLFIFCVAIYFLWATYDTELTSAAAWLSGYTYWIQIPIAMLPFATEGYQDVILNYPDILSNYYPSNASLPLFGEFIAVSLRSAVLVASPVLLWCGYQNIIAARSKGFTRKLDIWALVEIYRNRYPRIRPATAQNLLQEDSRFGPWATQRNPVKYCLHLNLLRSVQTDHLATLELPSIQNLEPEDRYELLDQYYGALEINKDSLYTALCGQLGPRCHYRTDGSLDHDSLPPAHRALWIVFLGCISQDRKVRKEVNRLLDQFGATWIEGNKEKPHEIDLSGVDDLYDMITQKIPKKHRFKVTSALSTAKRRHAYWSTAFTYIYELAEDNFKSICTRDFIWLKVVDRSLFFALNQIGLQRARTEAAGIRSHFRAELRIDKPIARPYVHSAYMDNLLDIQEEGWLHKDIVIVPEGERRPVFISDYERQQREQQDQQESAA